MKSTTADITGLIEPLEKSGLDSYQALVDFSLGIENDLTTMKVLGLDSAEDLFLLMAKSHLPMPRLSSARTQEMVDDLNALSRDKRINNF